MKSTFTNKIAYFILTFFLLVIVASFLFSGFDNFKLGGAKNVATVDGTPISAREFQTALSRQIDFFNQMMGGKGMTQKQLEEMGIKQSVLNGLIQQKLILNSADSLGFVVSLEEVKGEIKNLPYFKTNEQFDVSKYRSLLGANGYTPTQFEELIGNDLKQKKMDEFFNNVLMAENSVKDILRFKNNIVSVSAIKISRQSLAPLVSVSDQEIKDYIAKAENKKNLESLYADNFSKYNQPEEVKARHILIKDEDGKGLEKIKSIVSKLNTKNFQELANKETQDPSGSKNGGDLGWFARGRMVPEFEDVAFTLAKGKISEPVKTQFGYHLILVEDKKAAQTKTLENVQEELARMAIQKTKAQDLDQLLKAEQEKMTSLLKANDVKAVEATSKKVEGQFFNNQDINEFDQTIGQLTLSPSESEQVFKAAAGEVLNFGNPGTIYLVKVNGKKAGTDTDKMIEEKLKTELSSQSQAFSRKVRDELIKAMNNKAKIITNAGLI